MPQMRELIATIQGSIGRGAATAIAWHVYRAIASLCWVIIVARLLGPADYGLLMGVWSVAAIVGTLTGLGQGLVMLIDVPREPRLFGSLWRRALSFSTVTGLLLLAVFVIAAPWVLQTSTSRWLLVMIGAAEILCFPQTVIASYAFQAHERMGWASAVYAGFQTTSLLVALAYALMSSVPALETYAGLHACGALASSLLALWSVRAILRPSVASQGCEATPVRRAFGLSVARVVDNGLTSIDKALVLRLGGDEMAGIYAVTGRMATALALPIVTLSSAALPRLSRDGTRANIWTPLVRQLFVVSIVWGILASAGMVVLGQLVPILFGDEFVRAGQLSLRMAWLPGLLGLSAIASTILLASGMHWARVMVQLAGITLLFGTSFTLIPVYGVDGAAVSSFAALILSVGGLWLVIRTACRYRNPQSSTEGAGQ